MDWKRATVLMQMSKTKQHKFTKSGFALHIKWMFPQNQCRKMIFFILCCCCRSFEIRDIEVKFEWENPLKLMWTPPKRALHYNCAVLCCAVQQKHKQNLIPVFLLNWNEKQNGARYSIWLNGRLMSHRFRRNRCHRDYAQIGRQE